MLTKLNEKFIKARREYENLLEESIKQDHRYSRYYSDFQPSSNVRYTSNIDAIHSEDPDALTYPRIVKPRPQGHLRDSDTGHPSTISSREAETSLLPQQGQSGYLHTGDHVGSNQANPRDSNTEYPLPSQEMPPREGQWGYLRSRTRMETPGAMLDDQLQCPQCGTISAAYSFRRFKEPYEQGREEDITYRCTVCDHEWE